MIDKIKTNFTMMAIEDCESEALNLSGSSFVCSSEDVDNALKSFFDESFNGGNHDYSVTYTYGHWGGERYKWEYAGCEIYRPDDITKPALVVVRYKPAPTHHSLQ